MQKYFENIESIDRFTQSLDVHKDALQCQHCLRNGQFVSHGFVYKQRSQNRREIVGKRILCSARYGRLGCGRTVRLYLAKQLPFLHYDASHLFVFLSLLLLNLSVRSAYQKASGQFEARNAWRWLNKLYGKLVNYRSFLKARSNHSCSPFKDRTRRLQVLLPTIARLFSVIHPCPCSNYQTHCQHGFI